MLFLGGMKKEDHLRTTKTGAPWAIICGTYLNAYSLVQSLHAIGWPGNIVCLKEPNERISFMECVHPRIPVVRIPPTRPHQLRDFIARSFPPDDVKHIFFTSEKHHEAFLEEIAEPRIRNASFRLGSTKYLETILDRYMFYQFVESVGAGPSPITLEGGSDPTRVFRQAFFLRPRKTWKGKIKLPRPTIVFSKRHLSSLLDSWRRIGLNECDWCFQEMLSTRPTDNLSICGWHDAREGLYFCTRHILRHPEVVGNGDLTERIKPPSELLERTKRILNGLEYDGPFELEYILDPSSGQYKPIEMNPRFWMQHGLIERNTDYALIRKYLGMPTQVAAKQRDSVTYWVNSIYAVFRLMRMDFRIYPFLNSQRALMVPGLKTALYWSFYYPLQKFSSSRNG